MTREDMFYRHDVYFPSLTTYEKDILGHNFEAIGNHLINQTNEIEKLKKELSKSNFWLGIALGTGIYAYIKYRKLKKKVDATIETVNHNANSHNKNYDEFDERLKKLEEEQQKGE